MEKNNSASKCELLSKRTQMLDINYFDTYVAPLLVKSTYVCSVENQYAQVCNGHTFFPSHSRDTGTAHRTVHRSRI